MRRLVRRALPRSNAEWIRPVHVNWVNNPCWKVYYERIKPRLDILRKHGHIVSPAEDLLFRPLAIDKHKIKVVILGRGPYANPKWNHGLAFSVPAKYKLAIPTQVGNLLEEYQNDLGFNKPRSGNLSRWSENGILLINRLWTNCDVKTEGHDELGWETFTLNILSDVSYSCDRVVFILLGREAQKHRGIIDESKHLVLALPSPNQSSARRGFFGSKMFSRACSYLKMPKSMWRLE